MKSLIFLSPYFFPEDFQFNKLYFEMAKKHKIYVITGFQIIEQINISQDTVY